MSRTLLTPDFRARLGYCSSFKFGRRVWARCGVHFGRFGAQLRPQNGPRTAHNRPRFYRKTDGAAQEAAKKAPRRPSGPQNSPRALQDGPRGPQDRFKTAQEAAKKAPKLPKRAPTRPKRPPGLPNRGAREAHEEEPEQTFRALRPKKPHRRPQEPQETLRGPQEARRGPREAQRRPNTVPEAPKDITGTRMVPL